MKQAQPNVTRPPHAHTRRTYAYHSNNSNNKKPDYVPIHQRQRAPVSTPIGVGGCNSTKITAPRCALSINKTTNTTAASAAYQSRSSRGRRPAFGHIFPGHSSSSSSSPSSPERFGNCVIFSPLRSPPSCSCPSGFGNAAGVAAIAARSAGT